MAEVILKYSYGWRWGTGFEKTLSSGMEGVSGYVRGKDKSLGLL